MSLLRVGVVVCALFRLPARPADTPMQIPGMVNEPAALLWAVNLGSIELHSSLHTRADLDRPTVLAFDLDPGPGTNILHCGEVALRLRALFDALEMTSCAKTSGSQGLQLYVPLNVDVTPLTWREVEDAVDAGDPGQLSFEMPEVVERVREHGDLFAPVLTCRAESWALSRPGATQAGRVSRRSPLVRPQPE